MNEPRPAALRLVTSAKRFVAPEPPFGLERWSDDASDVAVLLDANVKTATDVDAIASQLPAPEDLAPDAWVILLGAAARPEPTWRSLWGRAAVVPRHVRCSAALVRGFVCIGAASNAADEAIVWARAADASRPPPGLQLTF